MDTTQVGLEIAKLIVTTLATSVAAWFGIRIAASQRDIARRQAATAGEAREIAQAKLNLDLFTERYKLFEQTWAFLSTASNVGETTQITSNFTNLIPRARFLFGDEVADFMSESSKRRSWLVISHRAYSAQYDVEHAKNISLQTTWLIDAASNCHKKFAPYLDFSEWQAQRWTKRLVETTSL